MARFKNGELLTRAEAARFSAFLTDDQNLEFQQNISKRLLGVVVLRVDSNALEDLLPLIPAALSAIEEVQPGHLVRVVASLLDKDAPLWGSLLLATNEAREETPRTPAAPRGALDGESTAVPRRSDWS